MNILFKNLDLIRIIRLITITSVVVGAKRTVDIGLGSSVVELLTPRVQFNSIQIYIYHKAFRALLNLITPRPKVSPPIRPTQRILYALIKPCNFTISYFLVCVPQTWLILLWICDHLIRVEKNTRVTPRSSLSTLPAGSGTKHGFWKGGGGNLSKYSWRVNKQKIIKNQRKS